MAHIEQQGVPTTREHLGTYMEPHNGPNTTIKRRPAEGSWPNL
jgi:hypothetical protein